VGAPNILRIFPVGIDTTVASLGDYSFDKKSKSIVGRKTQKVISETGLPIMEGVSATLPSISKMEIVEKEHQNGEEAIKQMADDRFA